jgi:hypothetical protein
MQDGPLSAIVPGGKLLPGLHEGRSRWYAWWNDAGGVEGIWRILERGKGPFSSFRMKDRWVWVCRCEGLGWIGFVGFEYVSFGLGRSGGIGRG